LSPLESAPPAEFDGPGNLWSPETLLLAAVTDCFILSFRVIAANSSLEWTELQCEAEGVVDRAEGGLRFTEIHLRATLTLPSGQRTDRAQRMLERAEKSCLVSNSLATPVHLEAQIRETAT
jgi:peroxiredoxin-like protein